MRALWHHAGSVLAIAVLVGCSAGSPSEQASEAPSEQASVDEGSDRDDRSTDQAGTARRSGQLDLDRTEPRTLDLPERRSPAVFAFPGIEVTLDRDVAEEDDAGENDAGEGHAEEEPCVLEVTATNRAVPFEWNSATITPEGRRVLGLLAEELAGVEEVSVVGHTSTEGDRDWNQTLSEQRAAAVKVVLAELLGDGPVLNGTGRGELEPVQEPDETEWQRELNRRVVITAPVDPERCDV